MRQLTFGSGELNHWNWFDMVYNQALDRFFSFRGAAWLYCSFSEFVVGHIIVQGHFSQVEIGFP